MENKEILKKYIEMYSLKETQYSFNESFSSDNTFIEWLYFKHGEYMYCISCDYNPTKKGKHCYVFSKIDSYGREYFIYNGFSEKKLVKLLKEILNIE